MPSKQAIHCVEVTGPRVSVQYKCDGVQSAYKCDGVQSARIATGSGECSPQGRDLSRFQAYSSQVYLLLFYFISFFILLFLFSFFGNNLPAHTQWTGLMLLNVHRGEEAY